MQPYGNEFFTTFVLLRPNTSTRPSITNTERPAGHGFNLALRAMASRNGFQTQWFGWQHQSSSSHESEECPNRLFWVINWQDSSSAQALTLTGELEKAMGDLARFFELPKATPSTHCVNPEVGSSSILVVNWHHGDAQKLLNWTNRDLILGIFKKTSHKSAASAKQAEAVMSDTWLAYGQVIAPEAKDKDWTSAVVVLQSLQLREQEQDVAAETHIDCEMHDRPEAFLRVSLTRTRWCTKIRKDLMETIKSKRID